MLTYDQSIKNYQQLNYEQKRKKIVSMLEILKEDGNIFQDLWDLININQQVSEGVIDMIFEVITKAMFSIKERELEDAVIKLEKVKDKMGELKEQEASEMEDVESILQDIA